MANSPLSRRFFLVFPRLVTASREPNHKEHLVVSQTLFFWQLLHQVPDVSAGRPEHLLLGKGSLKRLVLGLSRHRVVPSVGLCVVQTYVQSLGL
jgi:hypothetical protein